MMPILAQASVGPLFWFPALPLHYGWGVWFCSVRVWFLKLDTIADSCDPSGHFDLKQCPTLERFLRMLCTGGAVVATFQCSVIQGNDTAMTFGAYSQTSVFIHVYCLVLYYLRTVSAYIIHSLSGLVGPLFITFYLDRMLLLCGNHVVHGWVRLGFRNFWYYWLTSLDLFYIHITDRNMCCDCNVSGDTYGSFLFNSEIHSEFQTNIWLQVLPNLPLQHVTVAASQAVRRQLDYAYWIVSSTMLKCILNCFALFIAALWISKRRDLMGYGISWNTMRCGYYEM